MLSDEEKQAIDDLFALTHINGYIDLYTQKEAKIHTLDLSKWQNGVKVLLNLIEKQSKEIEELKEMNNNLNWYFENQVEGWDCWEMRFRKGVVIWKTPLKNVIKHIKSH